MRLVLRSKSSYLSIDTLSPFPSARSRSPTVLNADYNISLISQVLMPQVTSLPYILHRRAGRFTVHINDDRIFLRRIKINGLDHPCIQLQVSGTGFDKLLRTQLKLLILRCSFLVIFNDRHRFMRRQGHHLYPRRSHRVAERMYRIFPVGRQIVPMLSLLIHRTEAFHFTLS